WAELVVISGMIVQKDDMQQQIADAKRRGLTVAVGGPFASSTPEAPELDLADFKVLDEGEITLPMFLEAIQSGKTSGRFSAEGDKPDVTETPIPRFDLLNLDAYDSMSVQFSRGCPFNCEFCDIIVLYGRIPRTKTPEQLIAELQTLYDLGWRRSIFLVDDNFIGNKRNAKLLLKAIRQWQEEKGYPFSFATEASVNLADDDEMMRMMHEARFESVFLGIETPDESSLETAGKVQNTRNPLDAAVDLITANGIRVMAGFIIGFDGEKDGAGGRIVDFVTRTGIPAAMMGMLQALPNTALWHRLEKEDRLIQDKDAAKGVNQTNLLNFKPTRPIRDIANEYVEAFCALYEPNAYMDRVYSYYLKMGAPRWKAAAKLPTWIDIRALTIVIWRQGIKRNTRSRFWRYMLGMARQNPAMLEQFLVVLAHNEHFLEYRAIVQQQIREQLELLPPEGNSSQKALQAV
ncbi:MAG: B12-binding domain-containing radical SAM protein, partial [Prochlorococcus sp.]